MVITRLIISVTSSRLGWTLVTTGAAVFAVSFGAVLCGVGGVVGTGMAPECSCGCPVASSVLCAVAATAAVVAAAFASEEADIALVGVTGFHTTLLATMKD